MIEERETFEPIIYVKKVISDENSPVLIPQEIYETYYEF